MGFANGQRTPHASATASTQEGSQAPQEDSPAQQRIAAAERQIHTNPKKIQAFNELALEYIRRAREKADPRFLANAEQALAQGLKLDGSDFQLPKENLAWLYFELGEFYTQAGNAAAANTAYLDALTVHPGDYRALAGMGKLRANQGRFAEAITLYEKAVAIVPYPIFVAELGDLYAKAGNQLEAQKQFRLVEYIGLLGHINQVLHNRDLAVFYADHDIKLPEAPQVGPQGVSSAT